MTEKSHIPKDDNDTNLETSDSFSDPSLSHEAVGDTVIDHSDGIMTGIFDDFSPQVVSIYENLLEQEAAPADLNEIIPLGTVEVGSLECEQLLQAGISQSTIEAGNVTRKELLNAGFAFLNKIGGGEKSLISTIIKMEDGSTVDTGRRVLLTGSELDVVQHSQGSFNMANNEQVRLTMINFLQASKEVMGFKPEIKNAIFKEAQNRIFDSGNEESLALIGGLFQSIIESGDNRKLAFMIDYCVANLSITKVGGIPIDMYASRSSILQGAPSPFLDSGYHFDTNDDVTIYPDDPTKTRRLNSVVVHLLSRGLNEEGASINDSHDQTYITSKEFTELINSFDESDSGFYDNEVVETFIVRLLENARREGAQ
jgi:hypothetical protein